MLNSIVKCLCGKELVVINWHRCTLPFNNEENRRRYVFADYLPLWKATRIFGRNGRLRYRAMAFLLSVLKPAFIIEINWTARLNRLYLVWCRKHRPSQFIVVQHGLYIGGIITDKAHRYAKCDVMLCWGEQSIAELRRYNLRRRTRFLPWGNPLYNQHERGQFNYKLAPGFKVLVAPTLVLGNRKTEFEELIGKLVALGFEVSIKEHLYQPTRSQHLVGAPRISGDLYRILERQEFDILISDTSTCLIDALYFKSRALFFSPSGDLPEYRDNAYSRRMVNQVDHFRSWQSREDVLRCIDIEAQEALLHDIVFAGDNALAKLATV